MPPDLPSRARSDRLEPEPSLRAKRARLAAQASIPLADRWTTHLHLEPEALRKTDPIPLLIGRISEHRELSAHEQNLALILGELFSNALDHGLLGLDSALKDGPAGFTRYYQERNERLNALSEGSIDVSLSHEPHPTGGGRLVLEVADTGPGFDWTRCSVPLEQNDRAGGRGIRLVQALTREVTFLGCGNRVRVVYEWDPDPAGTAGPEVDGVPAGEG